MDGIIARWTVSAICVFLVAALLLVYGQVINHRFIDLGDSLCVTANPLVTSGLKPGGIFHAFWGAASNETGFYTPFTTISHMVNWQFYNQFDEKSAFGHHLMNGLLHGAAVILLFLTLRLITGAIWRSAFVAALFAVHPIQVESVSWVAQRGDVMGGLFLILAIGAYVRYVYRPWSLARYLTVMALFAAGLMSSPALVAFPFVLLLLDYWPLGRYSQPVYVSDDGPAQQDFVTVFLRLFTEKIPFFAASFLGFMLALVARHKVGDSLDTFSLAGRISRTIISSITGIGRVLYPGGLTVFYSHSTGGSAFLAFLMAVILLVVITGGAFFLRKSHPYLIVGWLWYLGMLLPAVGWGAGGVYAGADHYFYLPGIGLFTMIAWGMWDLCASLTRRTWIAAGGLVVTMSVLIACARTQCSYWHDGESLWNHALALTTDNYVAYNNRGLALVEKGNIEDGIADYKKAIEIRPDYAEANDNIGTALIQKGNQDEAITHFQKALDIRPNFPQACIDMGIALAQKGRADEAITYYKRALQIRPDYAEAYYNLGTVLALKSDFPEAISNFEKALEIRPYYADAHYNLGIALTNKGDFQGAISHLKKALDIKPNLAEADYNLGIAFYQSGNVDDAIIQWQKALEIQPNYVEAHFYLGIALVQQGNLDEAIAHYRKALEITPYNAQIYTNLGTTLLQKKEFASACENFSKAVELAPNDLQPRNDLAWVLATCANASDRDGTRAVDLIETAAQSYGDKFPALLRTLAAAYAEAGAFFPGSTNRAAGLERVQ